MCWRRNAVSDERLKEDADVLGQQDGLIEDDFAASDLPGTIDFP
jgi:hypothetical protein